MAGEFKIEVFKRKLTKKSGMKTLRKEDKIPGVYYSHNSTQSVPLYITKNTFKDAQKSGAKIFNILVGDKKRNVIFKFIQYHPVTDEVLHLDLYGVDLNRPVVVSVVLILTGTATGVSQEGGVLVQSLNEVDVECLPLDIPDKIEVDISHLALNDSIKLVEIQIDGRLTLKTDVNQTIASVTHAMKEEEIVTVTDEEADEEFIEGEEGTEETADDKSEAKESNKDAGDSEKKQDE